MLLCGERNPGRHARLWRDDRTWNPSCEALDQLWQPPPPFGQRQHGLRRVLREMIRIRIHGRHAVVGSPLWLSRAVRALLTLGTASQLKVGKLRRQQARNHASDVQ